MIDQDAPQNGRELLERVAAYAELDEHDLDSLDVHSPIHRVRFAVVLAMYEAWSFPKAAIGRQLGRDHKTVMSALSRAQALYATDEAFRALAAYAVASARENRGLAARTNPYVKKIGIAA